MFSRAANSRLHGSAVRRAAVGGALRIVAHPAILAAIVFLLINDHLVAAGNGVRNSFYRSDDGGLTWQRLDYSANQYPDPENPYLPDVQCPS